MDDHSRFVEINDLIQQAQQAGPQKLYVAISIANVEFENDIGHDFSQKADWWSELGDSYRAIGEMAQARDAWLRALKLARMGLTNLNPQDALGSRYVLAETSKKLADAGYACDALEMTV
jgi:tetratricopeptide (TPR) repeat protein